MEQTVNLFNKGLQMDTNPMVQGSDTLSDALNATFVTMNGNEVILQNDMGNRRVDNAYLPPGYEPVGIKEYGGVIYIAAYNPITNHSLIGSFPSPERKIDYNDDSSLKSDFDFENFVSTVGGNIVTDSELKIPVIINDSFLIPLTKTNTLHVGDKFVVYAPNLSGMKNDISNYDNIDSESDKVYSPKNRKYTIQIGVLNELNNFNDITKYLVRWDDESHANIIKDLGNKSDLYKFNKGYFIPDGFTSLTDIEGNTIDDTNLILSRKQIVANTFSYKLAGPLYLKTEYNHISNFGFKYTGKRTLSNNIEYIELTIEGYFTYNCPDGVINGSPVDDNDYYTYALNVENLSTDYINFDLYDNTGEIVYKLNPIIKEGKEEIKFLSHTYDKITNQYKVVLTKKYELQYDENNPIFKYIIGVKGGICSNNNKDFYIKGLSSKGEINLSLLNSGELNLRQYKFYNKASSLDTIMLLNFESYPKAGESFENLYLEFKNINNNDVSDLDSHYLYTELPILNGQQIINFNWEKSLVDSHNNEYPLLPRKTYKVKIHYIHKTESENEKIYEENINRWFLTTELFNDLYNTSISDICITDDERFKEKITIKPDVNNLEGIYLVTYGDVTYYNPQTIIDKESEIQELLDQLASGGIPYQLRLQLILQIITILKEIDDIKNIIPIYRTEQKSSDSITLYLTIDIIKNQSSKELDVSLYPDYIENVYLNIQKGLEDDHVILSETIEKLSYKALNTVYYPLRTVEQYVDDYANLVLLVHTESENGDDYSWVRVSYKNTNEWPNNYPETTNHNDGVTYDNSYTQIFEEKEYDNGVQLEINTIDNANLYNIPNIDSYSKFLIKAFCVFDWDGDIDDSYLLGSCYGVFNEDSLLIFIKPKYLNNSVKELLINWNEISTSGSTVFKIIGDSDPEIKSYSKTLSYEVFLESNWQDIQIGNLMFTIKDCDYIDENTEEKIPFYFELPIAYHNKYIVENYILYKNKSVDRYVDMNTGNKIINTTGEQETTDFSIKNYNQLIYTGTYTRYNGGDWEYCLAYAHTDMSDHSNWAETARVKGNKRN